MHKLYVTVGMIASGKSTFCKRKAGEGAVIVNDDALVTALHGGEYGLYRSQYKPLYKAVELDVITQALGMGLDVVVDRPCFKPETRRRYAAIATSVDVPAACVIFHKDKAEVHAKRRVASDPRGHDFEYWLRVAKEHEGDYVAPDPEAEGFDETVLIPRIEDDRYAVARRTTASGLADWVSGQGSAWWSVDGERAMTGACNFPCPSDEMATALGRFGEKPVEILRAAGDPAVAGDLGELADTANNHGNRCFLLRWGGEAELWMINEDRLAAAEWNAPA